MPGIGPGLMGSEELKERDEQVGAGFVSLLLLQEEAKKKSIINGIQSFFISFKL